MRAVGAQGDGAGTLGLARTRLTFVRTRPEAPRVPSEAGVMGPLCRRGAVCRVRPRASSCVGVRPGRECACGPRCGAGFCVGRRHGSSGRCERDLLGWELVNFCRATFGPATFPSVHYEWSWPESGHSRFEHTSAA